MALLTIKNANQAPRVKEIANENTANTHAKPATFRTMAGFIVNFAMKRCTGKYMRNMKPKILLYD